MTVSRLYRRDLHPDLSGLRHLEFIQLPAPLDGGAYLMRSTFFPCQPSTANC